MAIMGEGFTSGDLDAGEDLSSSQYRAVKVAADGDVELGDTAGEKVIGLLMNKPASGAVCEIRTHGYGKAKLGGNVNENDALTVDANGALAATTNIADYVLARAHKAGSSGDVIEVLITHEGINAGAEAACT